MCNAHFRTLASKDKKIAELQSMLDGRTKERDRIAEANEKANKKHAKLLAAFEAVKAEVNLMRHAITLSESSLDEERENIAQKQQNTDAALRELEAPVTT